jgi:hypothetical protein
MHRISGSVSELRNGSAAISNFFRRSKSRGWHEKVVLERDEQITLVLPFSRVLQRSSEWHRIGRIPEGEVYRPVSGVFTIEGANVHEAHLVVKGTTVVGFYLPGERAFAPLTAPKTISFKGD